MLLALNSTVEGMSQQKLFSCFDGVMAWIYENTQNQNLRVQSCAGSLIGLLSTHCAQVLIKDENSLGQFYNWFKASVVSPHSRIVMHSMKAISYLFISLDSLNQS